MTIQAEEANVVRFELLAMATRLKEIGQLCRNEWLLSPPSTWFDLGVAAGALEEHAASLTEIFNLPADTQLGDKTYPPGYEPPSGPLLPRWGTRAWGIVDRFIPARLSMLQRYLLAGLIAGTIERCVEEALDASPLQPVAEDDD